MKKQYFMVLFISIFSFYSSAEGKKEFQGNLSTTNLGVFKKTPLNDTGITWGADDVSGNNATCISDIAAPQDCYQGRDAQAAVGELMKRGGGHAGFDFTKLDASGNALKTQDATWDDNGNVSDGTKWSCVKDNHTGLIWEVKTNDGDIHDQNNGYRWGGKTAIGKGHEDATGDYYDDWDELVDGANSETLCGFTDWRVPDLEELLSIVDKGRRNPAIDINYFPNTLSAFYWSSSPNADNSSNAWLLNFYYGNDRHLSRSSSERDRDHVRLVRFGQ